VWATEAVRGLLSVPKTLPPKLFYDARGATLFEQITGLDEYYLTRSELQILERYAPEIAQVLGPDVALIEYGSGPATKVRLLLDALIKPAAYVPVDISEKQLREVAYARRLEYPMVQVLPVVADYTSRFVLPALAHGARKVAFFPGSTIGNFHPSEATAFLTRIRSVVGTSGAMILGVDRRKDVEALHAAYNDASGVTAAFNLNLLTRLNRELHGDFDISAFSHRAFFDPDNSRIEMHLVSERAQEVTIDSTTVRFNAGETIHTECSYKYDLERLEHVVNAAGFRIDRLWTDDRERFWVACLLPA
jgi:dimethylhistidine N-methyltransferase